MDTIIEKVDPAHIDTDVMEQAGKLIAEGELVAFPTETVYLKAKLRYPKPASAFDL